MGSNSWGTCEVHCDAYDQSLPVECACSRNRGSNNGSNEVAHHAQCYLRRHLGCKKKLFIHVFDPCFILGAISRTSSDLDHCYFNPVVALILVVRKSHVASRNEAHLWFWRFSWGSCIFTIVGSHAVVFLCFHPFAPPENLDIVGRASTTWCPWPDQNAVVTSVWEVKTCAKPVVDPFPYILYITVIYIISIIIHVSPFLGVENTCVHHLCCALLKIGGNLWGTFWFCFGVACASSMNHKNSQELQKKAFIQCSMNLLRHCY